MIQYKVHRARFELQTLKAKLKVFEKGYLEPYVRNFANICVSSCLSKFDNIKKIHPGVFEL